MTCSILSAIIASIVATKNRRKSRCCSAAKATFFPKPLLCCARDAAFVDTKLLSPLKIDKLGDNGNRWAMQTIALARLTLHVRNSPFSHGLGIRFVPGRRKSGAKVQWLPAALFLDKPARL